MYIRVYTTKLISEEQARRDSQICMGILHCLWSVNYPMRVHEALDQTSENIELLVHSNFKVQEITMLSAT